VSKKGSNRGKPWTSIEIALLRKSAKKMPAGLIASELDRTEAAVRAKASELGISLMPINRSPYNRRKR